MKAVTIRKEGDGFAVDELWNYTDNYVEYNTPVLKNGLLFAISQRGNFFCVNAKTGQAAWTQSVATTGSSSLRSRPVTVIAASVGGERSGGGRRGGRGGGMRGGGFGSVVDAGSVLIGLNSSSRLVVFEPSGEGYKELASYKVSDGQTYAYPVISGNRIFIQDQEAITLWTL